MKVKFKRTKIKKGKENLKKNLKKKRKTKRNEIEMIRK